MTNSEIFDFYDENWNDYNKIADLLHNIVDKHEAEIEALKNKLKKSADNEEINQMKNLLQDCQDKLDEERHRIR